MGMLTVSNERLPVYTSVGRQTIGYSFSRTNDKVDLAMH